MKRPLTRRRGLPAMVPGKKARKSRVQTQIVSLFGIAGVLMVILSAVAILTPPQVAHATSSENVTGWAWSDTGGWLSLNDTNAGSGGGSYGVNIDPGTRSVSGWAWSDSQGWACFGTTCASSSCANGATTPSGSAPDASVDVSDNLRGWGMFCNLGAPNGWISLNCLDAPGGCATVYGVIADFDTGTFSGFAWHGLSGPGVGWGWIDFSGAFSPPPETACIDALDNDLDGQTDCNDVSICQTLPECAWFRAQYGNIYAQQGANQTTVTPSGQTNATYCITSAGTVTNLSSTNSCLESSSDAGNPLSLPSGSAGYVSNLGKIDVTGILAGRYGTIVSVANNAAIPSILAGKVYVYDRDAQGNTCPSAGPNGANTAFTLNAKTFNNAAGSTGRGNGLIVIKGCDLLIQGDLDYQATGVSTYLRNLASLGVLTLSKYSGGVPVNGGNIYISSGVGEVVGLLYGERSINTGTNSGTDIPLQASGAFVSRNILLERRFGSISAAAEEVLYDGRGTANPPPGMQDVTKSLPNLTDTTY